MTPEEAAAFAIISAAMAADIRHSEHETLQHAFDVLGIGDYRNYLSKPDVFRALATRYRQLSVRGGPSG